MRDGKNDGYHCHTEHNVRLLMLHYDNRYICKQ